jgi:hypothetical protein
MITTRAGMAGAAVVVGLTDFTIAAMEATATSHKI